MQHIFESLGYEPLMVGYARIHSIPQNLRKVVAAGRRFTDGYSKRGNDTPGQDRRRSNAETEADEMRHEIAYLRQHVDFLKKITELGSERNRSK